ncbi:MAG: tripartite tricarboxylate transporter substrate-binding protein [Burkholderiales bacterium]
MPGEPPKSLRHVRTCRSRLSSDGRTPPASCSWHAILAPAKTPAPIVSRLNKDLVAILKHPDTQEKLSSEGGEVMPTTPEEAAAFIRTEVAKWSKLLKEADIPVE